jgi:hypothetical protein
MDRGRDGATATVGPGRCPPRRRTTRQDLDALTDLFCQDMRNDPDFSRSALRDVRDTGDELLLKITTLDVDGKTATATILNHGEDSDDIAFVREDGDWKWCES